MVVETDKQKSKANMWHVTCGERGSNPQSHLLPHHMNAHINKTSPKAKKPSRKERIVQINNRYNVTKKGLFT